MNNWKNIYNREERLNKIILDMLIKADGFDSPTGHFAVEDWIDYTKSHYKKLEIAEDDSIFDVGCGSGAFIYPLFLKKHNVGGIDFAESLIDIANAMIPHQDFSANEASFLETEKKYDIVLSHGVFLYFPTLDYAKKVIQRMIEKSNKTIAVLDINDKEKEERYHELRMQTMTKEEYEEKYKGLDHLFFSKDFFIEIAKAENLEIEIWDQDFEKYNNSQFRFNVVMRKG